MNKIKAGLTGLALIAMLGCGKGGVSKVFSRNVQTPRGVGIQYQIERGEKIETYIFKDEEFFGKNLVYINEDRNSVVFTLVNPEGLSAYKHKKMGL